MSPERSFCAKQYNDTSHFCLRVQHLKTTRITVCGNLTVDELEDAGRLSVSPGGSALFTSSAASFLGARVGILGNVGEDFPESNLRFLETRGVNLRWVRKVRGPSTRFRITQDKGSRRLSLLRRGAMIRTPRKVRSVQAIHLGPVFREISIPLAARLRTKCHFMSADLQGFIRRTSSNGLVRTERRNLNRLLKMCDMVQASIEEAKSQVQSGNGGNLVDQLMGAGPTFCILTLAKQGLILGIKPTRRYQIPAFPERHITDTTGAGDVLAGSWLVTYLSTRDPVWAAAVGSAFASLASRKTGLFKFHLARGELMRRASWVYNNVKASQDKKAWSLV